jgi:hypothetical protein
MDKQFSPSAARNTEPILAALRPPLDLDVTDPAWTEVVEPPYDVMVAVNLLHISPWEATLGLMSGAGRLLAPDGRLFIYGPFARGGDYLSQSNMQFDAALRHRNPAWGVRDVDDVAAAARGQGLDLAEVIEMPANNLMLVLARA